MSIDAPRPKKTVDIDYADHTLEFDTRLLFANSPEMKALRDTNNNIGDLDDTQVNLLLTGK